MAQSEEFLINSFFNSLVNETILADYIFKDTFDDSFIWKKY